MTTEKTLGHAATSAALPAAAEWATMASVAEALVRSGLLPAHVKTPQAALAIMLKGRELGIPAMQALGNIAVVNGKPTCNAELMLALTYRDHGDDALHIEETTAERCTVSYKRRSWAERRTYTFTMADAQRAGLAGSATWQKYPQALLRARCISAVARMAFPDSIAGMFGYEEMGAAVAVEDDGAVVLAAEQTALPPSQRPAVAQTSAAPAHVVRVAAVSNGPSAGGQTPTTLDRVAGEFAAAGAQDGQAPPATRGVEQAKADLKEACLRVGLPAPLTLRAVNALAGHYGARVVGSSAGVTAAWLDDLRAHLPDLPVGPLDAEHADERATLLEALRATCRTLGRPEPRDMDQLGALAAEAGMGRVASWDSVTAGWLEAIRRGVGGAPRTGGPSGAPTHAHAVDRAEQALAGWIAAAADGATLEQLATDVARAHDAGTLTDKAAEALLEAVDARGAELDLYGPTELEADATASVSDREAQRREVDAVTAG